MQSIVASYFPGRTISCTYFRRALVTFLTEHHLKLDQEGIAKFFTEKHAALINTSSDVLSTHYDRVHRSDVNQNTLKTVNNTVGMLPTGSMEKMLNKFQKQYEKKNDDFAESIDRIVKHRFVARSKVEFTVAFKDGSVKDFPGYRMIPFMHLVSAYWSSVGGRSCSSSPAAKSSKSVLNKEEPSEQDDEDEEGEDEDNEDDGEDDNDEEEASWSSFEAPSSEFESSSADESNSDEVSSSSSSESSSSSSSCSPSPSVSSSNSRCVMSKSTNINESFHIPSQTLPLSPVREDPEPVLSEVKLDRTPAPLVKPTTDPVLVLPEVKLDRTPAPPVKPTTSTSKSSVNEQVRVEPPLPKKSQNLLGNTAKKTPRASNKSGPPPKPARKGPFPPPDSDEESEKRWGSIFRVNLFPSAQRNTGEKRKISLALEPKSEDEKEAKKSKKM